MVKQNNKLPFILLSDPDKKVMTQYGAFGEKFEENPVPVENRIHRELWRFNAIWRFDCINAHIALDEFARFLCVT